MREHAIPQDITGYRFHIIGNMTIKQFAEIGAGVILAIILYATNLPVFIKWPLIVVAVGMGAMAAFVPIEERPFDHWIVTFFRVLYKPTKFFWRRKSKIPDAFLYEPNIDAGPTYAELDLKPARRQRIKEYLTSVEQPTELNQFDIYEMSRLESVMATFNADHTQASTTVRLVQKPDLKVRVRAFRAPGDGFDLPEETIFATPTTETTEEAAQRQLDLAQRARLTVNQVAQKINIPELEAVDVVSESIPIEEAGYQNEAATTEERAYVEFAPAVAEASVESQAATTNVDLPFPLPPTEPNKLVGMVLTPTNDLLNDAIVEIQTNDGQVARAVKTNALGQFFVTTPLANGTYTMLAEKDGYQFAPLSISLEGEIVPPIEIRSA